MLTYRQVQLQIDAIEVVLTAQGVKQYLLTYGQVVVPGVVEEDRLAVANVLRKDLQLRLMCGNRDAIDRVAEERSVAEYVHYIRAYELVRAGLGDQLVTTPGEGLTLLYHARLILVRVLLSYKEVKLVDLVASIRADDRIQLVCRSGQTLGQDDRLVVAIYNLVTVVVRIPCERLAVAEARRGLDRFDGVNVEGDDLL